MDGTPAGFPVLKHTVLLRLLIGHATEPEQTRAMLHDYLAELDAARADLGEVREALRGADQPGEPFRFPSLVADWGLDYFAAETRHARRTLAHLDEAGPTTGTETAPGDDGATA
jgi:hypothetical protein